jgi:hypothetical protein
MLHEFLTANREELIAIAPPLTKAEAGASLITMRWRLRRRCAIAICKSRRDTGSSLYGLRWLVESLSHTLAYGTSPCMAWAVQ